MPSLVVIGAQWGDEGKGKLVDYLTTQADYVVRFQGGNNAGHTLVVNGVKTKLNLVPSGILHPKVNCLIASGVVLNPEVLLEEMSKLKAAGVDVSPSRLVLDREAHLVLGYHAAIDQAREELKGKNKIGTTGRGIGPAYEDRAARCGVRVADLLALPELKQRLLQVIKERNDYLKHVLRSSIVIDFERQWEAIESFSKQIKPYIGNVSAILGKAVSREARIVFEGAQGTLLDQSFGTVPYVTSSSTISGAVCTGAGIGPKHINYVLGVAKAYCTRVGSGPFPSELTDALGDQIRERGAEYGTVTGRPRRCGWFDAVAMRRAARLNGLDSLAITKLDVLSGCDKVKILIKYRLDGVEIDDMPALASEIDRVEPVYIELAGWKEDLSSIDKWHKLPAEAKLYITTVAEIVGVPVSLVSVGAERTATLLLSSAGFLQNFLG